MVVQEERIHDESLKGNPTFGGFDVFNQQQQQQLQVVGTGLGNFSGTTSPLGLTLTKTPSFLELVESKISKKYDSKSADESSDESKKQKTKNGDAEKLKASNISASRLRIGSFERESKNDGDLVAKCYYAKRKLVWEMLDGGLKNKIEINWSEITAIKASFPKNQPSVLEIQSFQVNL
ncbi:hypothetical protein Sjap_007297 [Stephania japonica]|uniref:TRF2/HOY1 PH-like domain-containing protein n=1 Tax=Stephania japonica TaxID=461633 RepID=A0AAP0P9W3_9MAGN